MFCSQKVFSLRLDRIWRLNYNTTTVCNGTDRKEDACGWKKTSNGGRSEKNWAGAWKFEDSSAKRNCRKNKSGVVFGDLSENSEYDEAKNEQAIIEAKITQLEAMLKVVEVVDTDELSTDIVGVGSKVRILDMDMGEEEEYQIVGSAEADRWKTVFRMSRRWEKV